MYSGNQFGASAYAQVGVQTGVVGASPHRLIAMLFEGAREAIASARMNLGAGHTAKKGVAISRAIDIISGGLQQGLNPVAGGELAARLSSLYDYMSTRLLQANLNNDEALLIEVDGLLATLEDGWRQIDPATQALRSPAPMEA